MLSPHHSSERAAQQQDEIARQEARPGAQARVARPRLRYANVVASLALFVALGGSSYAAV